MNKVRALKLDVYKKQLAEELSFLDAVTIFTSDEYQQKYFNYSKDWFCGVETRRCIFPIYKPEEDQFLEEEPIYREALEFLKLKLDVFDKEDILVFTLNYKDESFIVECGCSDFYKNHKTIFTFIKYPIISDIKRKKILALIRLEYELELSWSIK